MVLLIGEASNIKTKIVDVQIVDVTTINKQTFIMLHAEAMDYWSQAFIGGILKLKTVKIEASTRADEMGRNWWIFLSWLVVVQEYLKTFGG